MLASSDVKVLEELIAANSDEELEDFLLEHYAAKVEYVATEAEEHRQSCFDFDACSTERFRELFRFEKQS